MAEEVDDEAVVESWEDFEENPSALEQQIRKMNVNEPVDHSKPNKIIINDDSRSTPLISQEPKIMILRRPPPNSEVPPNGIVSQKPKLPVKTLQQRQAAYAEARLRILGDKGAGDESKMKMMLQPRLIEQGQGTLLDDTLYQANILTDNCNQPEICKTPSYTMNASGGTPRPVAVIKPVNVKSSRPLMPYNFQQNSGNSGTS